jgi:hypothetical protein
VKVTGTNDHPDGLPKSKPVESKMYTATVFEKRARQPTLETYFKEK